MSDLSREYRFRSEGDLLVLQVEDHVQQVSNDFVGLEAGTKWRDAKIEDLLNVQFNKSPIKYPDLIQERNEFGFPCIGPVTCGHYHTEK